MTIAVETLEGLERRIPLTLTMDEITKETERRLQRLARTVKMAGFRPGKVPLKMVASSYGNQVQGEVISDQINAAFSAAAAETGVRVAGTPSVEVQNVEGAPAGQLNFVATFEVFPEVPSLDLATLTLEKATAEVGDAEIDRTLDILRKQRVTYTVVDRAAAADDRVTVDFVGKIDGVEFQGGKAEDFPFVLGQGRMLPEFETACLGLAPGGSREFDLTFPADYPGEEVAGKTAQFVATVKRVEAATLPELDAEFAKSLGVGDGNLDQMRSEIRSNLEREVRQRLRNRVKGAVMESLQKAVDFAVPKALVDSEAERLSQEARQRFEQQGMTDLANLPISAEAFKDRATQRVKLGLLLDALVKANEITAAPAQVKGLIEDIAAAYESPQEYVRWYMSDEQRVREAQSAVIEDNLVTLVLSKAQVTEVPVTMEALMAQN